MAQPAAQRNYLFDNLKGVAMLLVVFGHFIQPCIKESDLLKGIFFGIYTFHMPLFCLVSGYLYKVSRSSPWSRIKKYVLYLIIGQISFAAVCFVLQADVIYYSLLWYLIAMSFWVLLTPLLTKRGIWLPLIGALLSGLCIGLLPTEGFTIVSPRILTYYPYFLIGVLLFENRETPKPIHWSPMLKVSIGIVIIALIGFLITQLELINYRSVFLNQDYADMDVSIWTGLATRLSLYVIGTVAALGTYFSFPKQATWFSGIGRASVQIYLLHGLIIKALMLLWTDTMLTPATNLMISTGVAVILLLYGYRRYSIEKTTD